MVRSIITTIAVTAACGVMACASAPNRPDAASSVASMQDRLAASEEKTAQLSQQVALLQAMVDSHQRMLRDLENKDTDTMQSQAQPESPQPPTAPAPPAEETPVTAPPPSPLPETTEPPPVPETPSRPPEETAARVPTADTPSADTAADPKYQQAMEVFQSGDYESAAPMFEAFADTFPKDDLADNALYWAGECKYARKEFAGAIQRFKRVVAEYPNGSKVPDALLKIGFAYISLGDRESAATYLKQVVAQHPFSSAGAKAEARLRTMQKP
jgi:tol-pal system protein YbgF